MTRKQSISFALFLFVIVNIGSILFFRELSNVKIPSLRTQWEKVFSWKEDKKSKEEFFVKRVVDGDTIELESGPASTRLGEAGEKVRYIGINTPESVDPRRKVECFGKEAAQYNKELVEGKKVYLERDVSDRDKYGRLLRFVFLEDGTFINEVLVRDGYASVATYLPDISKQDLFRVAEQKARDEKRGLWNEETCNGKK